MTHQQQRLVRVLRIELLRNNYPKIFIVDNETLEAVEEHIREYLESIGEPPVLKCGKHGLYFKGVELVLKIE